MAPWHPPICAPAARAGPLRIGHSGALAETVPHRCGPRGSLPEPAGSGTRVPGEAPQAVYPL
jgi:hypothetical protein